MILASSTKPAIFDGADAEVSIARREVVGDGVLTIWIWVPAIVRIPSIPAADTEVAATVLEGRLILLVVPLSSFRHLYEQKQKRTVP